MGREDFFFLGGGGTSITERIAMSFLTDISPSGSPFFLSFFFSVFHRFITEWVAVFLCVF